MARNRIIYQSQAVEIDGTTCEGVQSCSYGLDVTREDVLQFGDLGAVDRIILEAPVANMEVSAYVNGLEGNKLGLLIGKGMSGTPIDTSIGLDGEGSDFAASDSTVTITSGSLTSFSAEASVGAIPTMTMGFEGTDLAYSAGGISAPGTSLNVATQSGVIVKFDQIASGEGFVDHYVHPQSCSVSFDLGVEGLQELSYETHAGLTGGGNKFLYARVPSYPATATMELEAFAVDKGMSMTLATLQQKASEGNAGKPNSGGKCTVGVDMGGTTFTLVGATLDAVAFSSAVGDTAATCNATFGVSIGAPDSANRLDIAGTTGP